VERAITGYHRDDVGDWVAELACGHDQHLRHRPPFQVRPWVSEEEGRRSRLGTPLECVLCDRAELPGHVRFVRSSPTWDETTLPPALRRSHRLASSTWGVLRVDEGALRIRLSSTTPQEMTIEAGGEQALPPDLVHEVEVVGPVRCSVAFFAVDRSGQPPESDETDEGGDPACWAGLLCPECGAMLDGAHRAGCGAGSSA